jgi:misacylated tRNA(Ala) deacylase
MTTEEVFVDDAYLRECKATIVGINDLGGIILDRTVFYPTGGGQPGDSGVLKRSNGQEVIVATTVKGDQPGEIVHVPADGQSLPDVGEKVAAVIDWDRRHRLMRIHTCLHLLSAVMPYPVTGGQISDGKGRLDFDLPEMPTTKEEITENLNKLVNQNLDLNFEWITDEELAANPDLVKTMSVKPPTGQGRVRMVRVSDCDYQPCGGTHVRNTSDIGAVRVRKVEKKGNQHRRVSIEFAD